MEGKLKIQNGEDRNGGGVRVGESVLVFSILFCFVLFDGRTTMKGRPCPGVVNIRGNLYFQPDCTPIIDFNKAELIHHHQQTA